MKFGIFRSDETGHRVENRKLSQLELTIYGIVRPNINRIWDTQTPEIVGGRGGLPYKNDTGACRTFMG